MGSERIQDRIELYRFNEVGGTFSGICTIIYDGGNAFIKGLHGSVGISDLKELRSYLSSVGVIEVSFIRHGNLIKKRVN